MWSVKHSCCHLFVCLTSLELFSPVCLQWCNLEHSHAIVSHCQIFHSDRSHSILYIVIYGGISNDTECTQTSVEKSTKITFRIKSRILIHLVVSDSADRYLHQCSLNERSNTDRVSKGCFSGQHCFFVLKLHM